MKIAINCWILRNKNVDGIGNFCIEVVRHLAMSHPQDEILLLCDKKFTEDYFNFPTVSIHRVLPPYRHPVLYVVYMETVVKYFLRKHQPDIFIGIEGFLSLGAKTPQLPVIHDLNFEHYPQDLPFRNRLYYRNFMPRFAAKAGRIATVSSYTKNDLVDKYKVSAEKIDVVYCGIKQKFQPLSKTEIADTRQKYTDGNPYFFFVGSMHPRKNLIRLIKAFDIFRKNNPQQKHRLVLSGNILWDHKMFDKVLSEISFKNDIIFTGRVTDEELKNLLGSAVALAFVPTFEGFGLPIVEAFQAAVPVVCSNVTSMPEVAGGAAFLVNPFEENDIARGLEEVANNTVLSQSLVEKGKKRKEFFNWQKTADLLYESVLKTINQSR